MSARSEMFTNKGVKTLKPFFSDQYILHFPPSNRCISGNNVTTNKIEVSSFPSESTVQIFSRSVSFWHSGSHVHVIILIKREAF